LVIVLSKYIQRNKTGPDFLSGASRERGLNSTFTTNFFAAGLLWATHNCDVPASAGRALPPNDLTISDVKFNDINTNRFLIVKRTAIKRLKHRLLAFSQMTT
jgi:hypothetical protein